MKVHAYSYSSAQVWITCMNKQSHTQLSFRWDSLKLGEEEHTHTHTRRRESYAEAETLQKFAWREGWNINTELTFA